MTIGCFQFDWEGDLPLKYPQKDLIIYEMHVRGFTRHESSRTKFPGTYHGVVEKLDHLKVLILVLKICQEVFLRKFCFCNYKTRSLPLKAIWY